MITLKLPSGKISFSPERVVIINIKEDKYEQDDKTYDVMIISIHLNNSRDNYVIDYPVGKVGESNTEKNIEFLFNNISKSCENAVNRKVITEYYTCKHKGNWLKIWLPNIITASIIKNSDNSGTLNITMDSSEKEIFINFKTYTDAEIELNAIIKKRGFYVPKSSEDVIKYIKSDSYKTVTLNTGIKNDIPEIIDNSNIKNELPIDMESLDLNNKEKEIKNN